MTIKKFVQSIVGLSLAALITATLAPATLAYAGTTKTWRCDGDVNCKKKGVRGRAVPLPGHQRVCRDAGGRDREPAFQV